MAKATKKAKDEDVEEVKNDSSKSVELSEKEQKKADKKADKQAKKEQKKIDKANKKKSKVFPIILLLIVVGLIGILVFNIFGIRDTYLRPYLEKIPFVNSVLPPVDDYANTSKQELAYENEKLTKTNEQLQQEVDDLKTQNKNYLDEIDRLSNLEQEQIDFINQKAEFDTMIANGDPAAFTTFYEELYPENAAAVYAELAQQNYDDAELKKYVGKFQAMEPKDAANILEVMLTTDVDLVVTILENIDTNTAAEIMASMTPDNAAIVATIMAPPLN